jgi:hypothetical protein
MALPRKLKYLNMFNDGLSYMGVVESVTLPKLTRKLEKYRGGGMPGSVSSTSASTTMRCRLSGRWAACLTPRCGRSTRHRARTACRCALPALSAR